MAFYTYSISASSSSTSAFVPFANINNFEYITLGVIDSRIKGLYKLLLREQYDKLHLSINDMFVNLIRVKEFDFDRKMYNIIYTEFARMKVEASLRKYQSVHNRLRDLHYLIENTVRDQMNDDIRDQNQIENDICDAFNDDIRKNQDQDQDPKQSVWINAWFPKTWELESGYESGCDTDCEFERFDSF